MPQGRMLNKKISNDEKLQNLSAETLLIFTWMIPHLDVKGRILGDPSYLKAKIFPLIDKISPKKIKTALKNLENKNLVIQYGDKIPYVQFKGFFKNQSINPEREAKSEIPDPPTPECAPDLTPDSTPDTSISISRSLNNSSGSSINNINIREQSKSTNHHHNHNELYKQLKRETELESMAPIGFNLVFGKQPNDSQLDKLVLLCDDKRFTDEELCKLLKQSFIEIYESDDPQKKKVAYLFSKFKGKKDDYYELKLRREKKKLEDANNAKLYEKYEKEKAEFNKTSEGEVGPISNFFTTNGHNSKPVGKPPPNRSPSVKPGTKEYETKRQEFLAEVNSKKSK